MAATDVASAADEIAKAMGHPESGQLQPQCGDKTAVLQSIGEVEVAEASSVNRLLESQIRELLKAGGSKKSDSIDQASTAAPSEASASAQSCSWQPAAVP